MKLQKKDFSISDIRIFALLLKHKPFEYKTNYFNIALKTGLSSSGTSARLRYLKSIGLLNRTPSKAYLIPEKYKAAIHKLVI